MMLVNAQLSNFRVNKFKVEYNAITHAFVVAGTYFILLVKLVEKFVNLRQQVPAALLLYVL